jgi:hypothetical protein
MGIGVGLMIVGAVVLRWGVMALRKKPTASSDSRVFLGATLFAGGAATFIVRATIYLLAE